MFSAIGRDESFTRANARRVRGILAGAVRGGLPHRRTDLVRHTASAVGRDDIGLLGLILLGLAAAVLCYALSVLILQAGGMKEEADLTI